MPLGIIDALTTDASLFAAHGSSLETMVKVAFLYGALYTCWVKYLQWSTNGTCIYPFVADLDSAAKCGAFVLIVGVAVSIIAYVVNFLMLL